MGTWVEDCDPLRGLVTTSRGSPYGGSVDSVLGRLNIPTVGPKSMGPSGVMPRDD
jgi:hypothetical protein